MELSPELFAANVRRAVDAIHQGKLKAQEYVQYFLANLKEHEPQVQSLAYWDVEHVLAQAKAIDKNRQQGQALGPLAGVPIAIKDVLDVRNMPTACGAQAVFHRQPNQDATCVALLRAAGGVILGKATTAEFAFAHPPSTRNPHNLSRTPGGSSSGSAAGVAAGIFPISLGTQTGGSIIRPASFCGVYGFKPTFGRISRQGLVPFAESFDTVGWFGRHLDDIELLFRVLTQDFDNNSFNAPRLVWFRGPYWSKTSSEMKALVQQCAQQLGAREVELPIDVQQVNAQHRLLMATEMLQSMRAVLPHAWDKMSPSLQQLIAEGEKITVGEIRQAHRDLEQARLLLDEFFAKVDVVLAPAAPGPAPEATSHTGNSVLNRYWSAMHVPCLSMPVGQDAQGLPMGVQFIARRFNDAQLLNWAHYVRAYLEV